MGWPTTSNPRTEFVTLRLTVDEAEALQQMADTRSQSRSEYVREALGRVVSADQRKQKRAEKKQP